MTIKPVQPMRRSLIVSLGLVAACASSASTPSPAATEMIRVPTANGSASVTSSVTANVTAVAAPIATVWRVMPAVFDSLSVPLTTVDPATHTIGNIEFRLRRRLGSVPLREYLNCGMTQGAPNTESYDVRMSVIARLATTAAGTTVTTTVTTTVQGAARPVSVSGDELRCSSTGALEIRLGKLVAAQLAR